MIEELRAKVNAYISVKASSFRKKQSTWLKDIELSKLLKNQDWFAHMVRQDGLASCVVLSLLDAELLRARKRFLSSTMEELATFVAQETGNGSRSTLTGIDIDLKRDGIRYLIAVKSCENWGNVSQNIELEKTFQVALTALTQSTYAETLQPTLGTCYGVFLGATHDLGYMHLGGQRFWHLLSGDGDFYNDLVEPLANRAQEFSDTFEDARIHAHNRLTRDFVVNFCAASGAINWKNLIEFRART